MKISASIYSATGQALEETVKSLDSSGADVLHVDCNDSAHVFDDIRQIRTWSKAPIDLHLISSTPEKYNILLEETKPDMLTYQYEQLRPGFTLPNLPETKFGLAIAGDTPIDVFEAYSDFSFILIMATTPGQSGGQFNQINFEKIRSFKRKFPHKSVHVDGGVNAEVSFILRNMGVDLAVSGSYLFKEKHIGTALVKLKASSVESAYKVKDFMHGLSEIPLLDLAEANLPKVLDSIEKGKMGFTLIKDQEQKLYGLISNADIRKGLLKHIQDFNRVNLHDIINRQPVCINEDFTVKEMLEFVRKKDFPISYMPVVNNKQEVRGALTFFNLVKGEL